MFFQQQHLVLKRDHFNMQLKFYYLEIKFIVCSIRFSKTILLSKFILLAQLLFSLLWTENSENKNKMNTPKPLRPNLRITNFHNLIMDIFYYESTQKELILFDQFSMAWPYWKRNA